MTGGRHFDPISRYALRNSAESGPVGGTPNMSNPYPGGDPSQPTFPQPASGGYPPPGQMPPQPGGFPGQPGGFPGQPGYGAPPMGGYQAAPSYVSWGTRVGAYFCDFAYSILLIIPAFVLFLLGAAIPKIGFIFAIIGGLAYLAAAFASLYFLYLTGSTGASPGKRVMGIQVINEQTGQFIGGGMGIVRGIAHIVDAIPCYIGFLFPLFDKKRQTLADKVMKTIVVPGPKLSFVDAIKAVLPTKQK